MVLDAVVARVRIHQSSIGLIIGIDEAPAGRVEGSHVAHHRMRDLQDDVTTLVITIVIAVFTITIFFMI